jgi:hypothetical protein
MSSSSSSITSSVAPSAPPLDEWQKWYTPAPEAGTIPDTSAPHDWLQQCNEYSLKKKIENHVSNAKKGALWAIAMSAIAMCSRNYAKKAMLPFVANLLSFSAGAVSLVFWASIVHNIYDLYMAKKLEGSAQQSNLAGRAEKTATEITTSNPLESALWAVAMAAIAVCSRNYAKKAMFPLAANFLAFSAGALGLYYLGTAVYSFYMAKKLERSAKQ